MEFSPLAGHGKEADSAAGPLSGRAKLLSQGEALTGSCQGELRATGVSPPNSAFSATEYAYVRRVPANADEHALDKALELLRKEEDSLPDVFRLGAEPRPVYELCLGSIQAQYKLKPWTAKGAG